MIIDAITTKTLSFSLHSPLCSFAPRKGFLPLELKYVVFSPQFGLLPIKSSKTDEPPTKTKTSCTTSFSRTSIVSFRFFLLSLSLSLLLLLFAPKTVVEDEVIRPIDPRCGRRCRQVRLLVRVARFFNARSFARRRPAARRDGPCRMFESRCFFSRARESRRGIYK